MARLLDESQQLEQFLPERIGDVVHTETWLTHRWCGPDVNIDHLKGFSSSRRRWLRTRFVPLSCGTCFVHTATWLVSIESEFPILTNPE